LIYAAEDVAHLPALAELLDERLAAAGRRGWLDEEAAALTDPAHYRADPEQAWRRLRGLERLDPQGRAVARTLAGWREERALARNLPRGWVLADAALLELARLRPQTRVALAELEALPRGTIERQGETLLAAIAAAAIREDDLDSNGAGRPDAAQQQQLKVLQQRLAGIAGELGIAPEVLATRRELAALVRGTHDLPVLAGWRRSVVGEALLAAL
jgi:ribonuclease D